MGVLSKITNGFPVAAKTPVAEIAPMAAVAAPPVAETAPPAALPASPLPPPTCCPICDCPAVWLSVYELDSSNPPWQCCDCSPPPGGWRRSAGGKGKPAGKGNPMVGRRLLLTTLADGAGEWEEWPHGGMGGQTQQAARGSVGDGQGEPGAVLDAQGPLQGLPGVPPPPRIWPGDFLGMRRGGRKPEVTNPFLRNL